MRSAVRSANPTVTAAAVEAIPEWLLLCGLLLVGLAVRVLLIGSEGYHGDLSSFESWSLTLADHSTRDFYASAGFADYPPGYFFILWIIGHAYRLVFPSNGWSMFHDPTYQWLKYAVKAPAILMDLVNAWLVYRIVKRFAALPWAFAAAALVAFNPATIFISAFWGQVDSVAAGLTLYSLLLMLDAGNKTGRELTRTVVFAWLVLAYSILIKPPAIVLVPLYLAFAFATGDAALRKSRLVGTAIGVAGGFALAFVAAFAFNPGFNPIDQYGWLIGRYKYAAGVYPYNSVNAFNLYEMFVSSRFWDSDTVILPNWHLGGFTIGFPQYVWGIVIFCAAALLVLSRYVQRREPVALLEAAMILSLGYFVLSTRMHERYIFNAMMLAIPLIWYKRRYLWAAVIISLTLLANLFYSLDYLYVMDHKVQGVDPANLSPLLSHLASTLNVATFFYLGYAFLGTGDDVLQTVDFRALAARFGTRVRSWFSPLEGVVAMTRPDWLIAGGMSLFAFGLSYVEYVWPTEKIFDEIYYARAGEEYLQHKEIFEFTHPPLTKLWITLSMILFGGMHGLGDTSAGWRFLNLVIGALMVLVMYCFAKRLLGSSLFATVAAGLLLFDGFRYVQSRIATPEIMVAFFVLLTLYAFYRYWLASQVRVFAQTTSGTLRVQGAVLGGGAVLGIGLAILAGRGDLGAETVAFAYVMAGAYLIARLFVPRALGAPTLTSYAEGSRVEGGTLRALDGGVVPVSGPLGAGESSTVAKNNTLVHEDDGLEITYSRGGAVKYETDDGTAEFAAAGTMRAGGATIDGTRHWLLWLGVLALSAACLGASKWNGLFDFFVVWALTLVVASQRYWAGALRGIGVAQVVAKPAAWGNPFGFSLDIVFAAMMFVGATVYTLCYIPYFGLGHNLADLIGLQHQMFGYHYDLTATHPYGSKWWQWPLLERPISYYYHDWRAGADTQNPTACCVAEIIALPNPLNWWSGLVSVPLIGWLAFREKNKGFLLLFVAYFFQWLPWIASPRVAFEYHFFPNLAIICLANAAILQRIWNLGEKQGTKITRYVIFGYCGAIVGLFAFFYPVLSGMHVPWNVWDARMWHWLMGYNWV